LHCEQRCEYLLCPVCIETLEIIDPRDRCPFCFLENEESRVCSFCKKNHARLRIASAFDYIGPITSLVKGLKYQKMAYLAQIAASFMFLQWEKLKWKTPDMIIPVPRSWIRSYVFGYNHTTLLSKHLASYMEVPTSRILRRKNFEIPQTQKNEKQRRSLPSHQFILKSSPPVFGKVILLVDDVTTTLSTLHACAQVLKRHHPQKIYALTLCRAVP
jgi:competence protein ComFC